MSRAFSVVSTDAADSTQKLQLWQDICAGIFGPPSCTVYGDSSFHGRIEYDTLGPMKVCKLSAGPHRVVRNWYPVGQGGGDSWKVVLQVTGSVVFQQPAKTIVLASREWILYDSAMPFSITSTEEVSQLILIFPKEDLALPGEEFRNSSVRKFSGTSGIGKLAYDFISSTFDELPVISANWERDILSTMTNLVRLAVLESSSDDLHLSGLEMLSQRIKTYIGRHLQDPDLSIDEIAKSFRCTKRYLHKAFEDQCISISDHIWKARLERCKEDLANPAKSAESILEVALRWGFKSPTHFSKVFKETYGVMPRTMRQAHPRGARIEPRVAVGEAPGAEADVRDLALAGR